MLRPLLLGGSEMEAEPAMSEKLVSDAVGVSDVKLHPLCIINISEHFTRLRAQSGDAATRGQCAAACVVAQASWGWPCVRGGCTKGAGDGSAVLRCRPPLAARAQGA